VAQKVSSQWIDIGGTKVSSQWIDTGHVDDVALFECKGECAIVDPFFKRNAN
jgi:hypothetical protein